MPSASRTVQTRGIANDGAGSPGLASPPIRRANYYSSLTRFQQNFAPSAQRPVTRNASHADEAKVLETVLQNFQLERAGRDVLVVDQDGSVYRGKARVFEEADLADRELQADKENVEKGKAALGKDPVLQARPGGWATNGFWFQVIGTNRTLTQRVVFEGNFLNELAVKPKMSAGREGAGQGQEAASRAEEDRSPAAPAHSGPRAGGAAEVRRRCAQRAVPALHQGGAGQT